MAELRPRSENIFELNSCDIPNFAASNYTFDLELNRAISLPRARSHRDRYKLL